MDVIMDMSDNVGTGTRPHNAQATPIRKKKLPLKNVNESLATGVSAQAGNKHIDTPMPKPLLRKGRGKRLPPTTPGRSNQTPTRALPTPPSTVATSSSSAPPSSSRRRRLPSAPRLPPPPMATLDENEEASKLEIRSASVPTVPELDIFQLPTNVWECIAKSLNVRDIVALSSVCRKAYKMAHGLQSLTSRDLIQLEHNLVPLERLGVVLEAWKTLKFAYDCYKHTSGTFWSESANGFVEASMLFQCAKLNSVSITECDDVTDVAPIKNIPKITLNRCNGIQDLSPLGQAQDLTVQRCLRVSDVSVLKDVTSLTLDRCPKVLDINGLGHGNLVKLTLRKCRNIRDLSGLASSSVLRIVKLEQMHNVEDVSMLTTLDELHLVECPTISDVSMLGGIRRLVVARCRKLKSLGDLEGLEGVEFESFNQQHHQSASPLLRPCSTPLGRISRSTDSDSPNFVLEGDSESDSGSANVIRPIGGVPPRSNEKNGEKTNINSPSNWVERVKRFSMLAKERKAAEEAEAMAARREELARRLEEDDAQILAEAEELAKFQEVHIQGREMRRQKALERKLSLEQAEKEAKATVSKLKESEQAARLKKIEVDEQLRAARKNRVAALLTKVRVVNAFDVTGL
eukprot:m.27817 g.27817  ORF g.27817 m.27817 type:complete len:629 (+) comp7939_c0_seq4:168-2054(+)